MNYRNQKLLDAARDVPWCMGCGRSNRGDIVAAHSNQQCDGKGTGIKAHDYRVAFLCHVCHTRIDQGRDMKRDERIAFWEAAHRKSVAWLFESGKVVCK